MKKVRQLLCLTLCLLMTACATQVALSEKLDRNVKSFNQMLRWHEIENAGITYIDSEKQESYQKQAATLKQKGISVTDYRIITTKYVPEKKSAEVVAEFDYYILPSNRIKTISYPQEWLYREKLDSWKLQSGLPDFD